MANWKPVPHYEDLYLISDEGEVISLPRIVSARNANGEMLVHRKQKKLKSYLRGHDYRMYPAVTLTDKQGHSVGYSLHRLVAEAFIPNPNNYPVINHIDNDPMNCSVANLEWCTQQHNCEYSNAKPVAQFLFGEKIAEYKSVVYASQLTGIHRNAIQNALKGHSKSAGGYEWKYI